ncbi:MAG: alkaline phosphatase family protein [Bacteroidaceae bacterium]|nr:alkaline phosphatase family protein [Bacteroidaceae bacterium]
MKRQLMTILLCVAAMSAMSQVERPKLVVGLVVDQMRWDYLYYYYDKFGQGGLRRLVDEGFNCDNNLINYVPTITGIGHASIYTGTTPALHSIAGNDFYMDGKFTYCCSDPSVKGVGSEGSAGEMSPRKMTATTMGDMLKVATDFRSKVFGVAMKDRAAILPAGQSADAAYWWDNNVGHYITSTYYMEELPKWVKKFNAENTWNPGKDIKMSPVGVEKTFLMAQAIVENEQLGQRGECDMLCISVSPTDAIAHSFGTRGQENYDVYMQLDRDLAKFLDYLDTTIGKGQYLLFLSADHGAAHNSTMLNNHRIPAGGWSISDARKRLNAHLQEKFGLEKMVPYHSSYRLFFDRPGIQKAGLKLQDVVDEAIAFLKEEKDLLYVIDYAHATEAVIPASLKEQIINGWNAQRSGDIYCLTKSGLYDFVPEADYKGTTHGAWNPYDSHIPCVFFGWHVKHGHSSRTNYMIDVAPTICAMLHIQMPNSCIGNPIIEVADQDMR